MNAFEQLAEGQRKLAEKGVRQVARLPGFRRRHDTAVEAERKRHCLLDRTSTKAIRADKTQTRLDARVRPTAWTETPMDLTPDTLVHVVEMLMASGDARAVRALAVACRATASAVATALDAARRLLQRKNAALVDTRYAGREAAAAAAEADFVQAMASVGILHPVRQRALVVNACRVFFHDARSLLGHIQHACEFCSTAESVCIHRPAGPVALWACDKCARQHRVQFHVDKYPKEYGEAIVVHGRTHAQVRLPRREGPAYNYACAMLSKRNAHHRRMRARRASEVGSSRLIRRVHMTEFTPVMHACWEVNAYDNQRGDNMSGRPFTVPDDYLMFELWHALPAGIPSNLTFAAVLGLRESGDTLSEARREGAKRARERARLVRRRKAYNKIAKAHKGLIDAMRTLIRPRGYYGWVQILDVCMTARAFDVRWIFREISTIASNQYIDWRLSRYRILDTDEATREQAFARLERVIHAVKLMLTKAEQSWTNENPTRACILAIIKHLPLRYVDKYDPVWMVHAVKVLREADMTVTCIAPTPPSTLPILKTIVRMDGQLFNCGKNLVLEAVLSGYDLNRLVKACNHYDQLGDPPSLHQLVDIATRMANVTVYMGMSRKGVAERRDAVRLVLFSMPGAWPRLDTPP